MWQTVNMCMETQQSVLANEEPHFASHNQSGLVNGRQENVYHWNPATVQTNNATNELFSQDNTYSSINAEMLITKQSKTQTLKHVRPVLTMAD